MKVSYWVTLSLFLHFFLGLSFNYFSPSDSWSSAEEVLDLTVLPPMSSLSAKSASTKVKVSAPKKVAAVEATGDAKATATEVAEQQGVAGGDENSSAVGWSELTRYPKVLKEVKAVYPDEAKKAGADGPVVLEVLIDRSGKVRDVKVIKGQGSGLNEAAIMALKSFEFQPAFKDKEPVAVKIHYTYRFKLGVN